MKLYLTQAGRWAGTQADARVDGSFEQVEVPTDKPSLIDWLNAGKDLAFDKFEDPDLAAPTADGLTTKDGLFDPRGAMRLEEVVAKPTPAPTQPPAQSPNWRADSVMEWLLNEASTAQVEQLFARLGTRFAEQAK